MLPDSIWKKFQESRLTRYKVIQHYYKVINDVCTFSDKDFLILTHTDAQAYRDYLLNTKNLARSTVDERLRILKSVGSFIEENSSEFQLHDYKSPFSVLNFQINDFMFTDHQIPKAEQIDIFMDNASKTDASVFIASVLALRMCMATCEMVAIRRKHFTRLDDTGFRLSVPSDPKSVRNIPVPEDVIQCINIHHPGFFDKDDNAPLLIKNDNPISHHKGSISERALQIRVSSINKSLSDDKICLNLQNIRNFGILELLRHNTEEQVSAFTGLDGRWLYRFKEVLNERISKEINLSHISIRP